MRKSPAFDGLFRRAETPARKSGGLPALHPLTHHTDAGSGLDRAVVVGIADLKLSEMLVANRGATVEKAGVSLEDQEIERHFRVSAGEPDELVPCGVQIGDVVLRGALVTDPQIAGTARGENHIDIDRFPFRPVDLQLVFGAGGVLVKGHVQNGVQLGRAVQRRQRGFEFLVVGVEVVHQNAVGFLPLVELVVGGMVACHKISSISYLP